MNRFGRHFLATAVRRAKVITTISAYGPQSQQILFSNRLYSSLSPTKCARSLYATHKLSLDERLFISKRYIRGKANEEVAASQENDEEASDDESTQSQQQKPKEASDEEVKAFFQKHQIFVKGLGDTKIPKPIFDFDQLSLPDALKEKMAKFDYNSPTPIQAQSLPILFTGRDLIGIAQTGSGKTLAYLLPAFAKYFSVRSDYYNDPASLAAHRNPKKKPRILVLAPTRELAQQIQEVVTKFYLYKSVCCYGGSDRNKQQRYLETNSPMIVIGTPGRLKDLIDSRLLNFSEIDYLVIDEADRMLDMGFEPQIDYLIRTCPKERQTMMFSATWPDEVKDLVHKYLRPNHAFLSIGGTELTANHNIKQNVMVCFHSEKDDHLIEIMERHKGEKMIIFSNMKRVCDRVARTILGKSRVRAAPLHGDLTQRQRESTIEGFKSGHVRVLCATNVAARGLDISDVNVVINYEMPEDVETYVHRIGRTGRMENKGHAYTFFTDESKTDLARDLVNVLKESNNEVSEELAAIARQHRGGKTVKRDYSRDGRRDNPFEMSRSRNQSSGRPYGGGKSYGGGRPYGGGGYNQNRNNDFDDSDFEDYPRRGGGGGGGGNNRYQQNRGQQQQRRNRYDDDSDY